MPKRHGDKIKKMKKKDEQRSLMSRKMQKHQATKSKPLKHQNGRHR